MGDDDFVDYDPCEYCREQDGHLEMDKDGDLMCRCYDCPMGPRGPMIYEWGDD